MDNREQFTAQADSDSGSINAFVSEWAIQFGTVSKSARELLPLALNFFDHELGDKGERSQIIRLGVKLSHHRDQVLNGKVLKVTRTDDRAMYQVLPASKVM